MSSTPSNGPGPGPDRPPTNWLRLAVGLVGLAFSLTLIYLVLRDL